MRGSILATFSEADALAAAMRAVGVLSLATTRKGRFWARFSQVTPDQLRLIAVEESLPRIAFVKVPLDRILVVFTSEKSSRQSWNGMRMHAGHLIYWMLAQARTQELMAQVVGMPSACPKRSLRATSMR